MPKLVLGYSSYDDGVWLECAYCWDSVRLGFNPTPTQALEAERNWKECNCENAN